MDAALLFGIVERIRSDIYIYICMYVCACGERGTKGKESLVMSRILDRLRLTLRHR